MKLIDFQWKHECKILSKSDKWEQSCFMWMEGYDDAIVDFRNFAMRLTMLLHEWME